jgi:hypothetical protein
VWFFVGVCGFLWVCDGLYLLLQAATTLSWVPWGVPGDGNSLSVNAEPGATPSLASWGRPIFSVLEIKTHSGKKLGPYLSIQKEKTS